MIQDRYELVEQVGAGGMATVWKARDVVLGRMVAIKRLSPHLRSDRSAITAFAKEARAAARLSHSGIVTVYDTGSDDDGPYIVLELIEGKSLADRLSESGALPPAEVAAIVQQAAEALDHAHANGVIHRDVKPSNLILDDEGHVQLTDFGIARVADEATTSDGASLLGTIAYMAPELLEGQPASPASDVYSLAAVTHEMLTGRPPYEADNVAALLEAIRKGDLGAIGSVDPGMASAIKAAMSTDPSQRPESAGLFAASLLAGTTLPIRDSAAISPGHRSEHDTEVLSVPDRAERTSRLRWSWLLVASLLIVLALIAAGMMAPQTNVDPAAPEDLVASSTTTSEPTTSTSTSTTSTTTTLPDTPERLAEEIRVALARLSPPEFKPNDVRKVEDAFDKLMEEWAKEDIEKVGEEFEKVAEELGELPDSSERESIVELLVHLAEAMGFNVEESDD